MSPNGKTNQNFLRDTLSADELFGSLTPTHRRDLDAIMEHIRFLPDKTVISSGDQPLYIYIHQSGRATIFHDESGISGYAFPAEPSHIYGVIEALSGKTFNIRLKTITDSDFARIERDDFLRFVREQPTVAFKLAEILSRLYQNAVQLIKSH